MTSAVPIRIADAVTAELNGHTFDFGSFTAVRSYADWDDKFEDIKEDEPTVDVVFMAAATPELEDQSALDYEVSIDIAVRQRFGPASRNGLTGRLKNEAVDPLVKLIEDIHEKFVADRNETVLADEPTATWQESDVKLWWDRKKLRQGLFYGWVRLVFSISKDV